MYPLVYVTLLNLVIKSPHAKAQETILLSFITPCLINFGETYMVLDLCLQDITVAVHCESDDVQFLKNVKK
jgi:hypothetical protein